MANVGRGSTGSTLIGQGNSANAKFADIGTDSGLTDHGILVAQNNAPFVAVSPGSAGQVLTSNGAGLDASFQAVSASGAISSITGDSGGAQTPSSGNFNILGTGSITSVGTANTETIQLTGLTANNVLVGAGTATITKVAPSATSGIPLVSNGAASDPSFTTAVVAGGGTGRTSLTNHGVLVGAATAAITQLAAGSAGQVLQSGGASADPAYSTATYPSTAGTSGTLLQSNGTNIVNTTATYPGTAGTSGTILQSNGTNIVNTTATYPGTAGTTGTILRSNGTNLVNTTATYPTTTTANRILYSSATNTISEITSAANSILSTDGSSVPSFGTSLSNDYTFTTSTAGASRSVTVSNTDNTNGSSNAIFIHSVGGTSAGDAYDRYAVGSTRSYSVGIDNSDTQSFKINTGASATTGPSTGSNVMRIDNTGNVALPLNACCTADLNTGLTNATGDATFINPIIFDTDTGSFFDQNGNYDPTTGVFTANATGKYLVEARVTYNNIAAGHTSGIVRINLNGAAYAINQFNPAASANAAAEFTATISCILPIAATGTCAILGQVSGSTKTVGVKGNSSGSFTSLSVVLVS